MINFQTDAARLATVSQRITDYAWDIVQREGGYVDNPHDSGGPTNHGVTLVYARGQGLAFDLNGDGVVDVEDIKLITPAMAVAVFVIDFFLEPNFNVLPICMQPETFDEAVNGGKGAGAKVAQMTVNAIRAQNPALQAQFPALVVDGGIGAKTSLAAHYAFDAVGEKVLVDTYCDQRIAWYRHIAQAQPKDLIFLKGWIARANSFRE